MNVIEIFIALFSKLGSLISTISGLVDLNGKLYFNQKMYHTSAQLTLTLISFCSFIKSCFEDFSMKVVCAMA